MPTTGDATAQTGAPGAGSGNGNGNGAQNEVSGNGAAKTVTVASNVENALFAVQQQLLREAERVRIVPIPPPAPAPTTVPAAAPAPVPPVAPSVSPAPRAKRERPKPPPPPIRVREVQTPGEFDYDEDEDEDYESEFWGETRRPAERRLDPRDLSKDERKSLGKLRARKVRRIVRHVSPWSVFKFSIFFYLCMWLIMMVAGVILWKLSQTAGVIANFEKFYAKAAGEKSFAIDGRSLFRAGASAGGILVFAATGFTVLMAVLFNLITDLTGGVRLTVIELESTRRTLRRRGDPERLLARARVNPEELTEDDGDDDNETANANEEVLDSIAAKSLSPSRPAEIGSPSQPFDRALESTPAERTREVLPEPRRRPVEVAGDTDDSTSKSSSSKL